MAKSSVSKWMDKLSTLEGAVNDRRNVHDTVIQTPSPYLNFVFGHGWGLPLGYSAVLYGPPGSGKSLISYLMAGGVHKDYEDGIVLKFNTEFREEGQLDENLARICGIDWDRYKGIDANSPSEVFDQITKEVKAWCQDGMPLKAIILDSMNGIQGRRGESSESIDKVQIGDQALTNKEGLRRVLEVQRRHKFALIMTSHVSAEMDPIEQKRGNKYRMSASIGVQHHAEYFLFVERNLNKDAREDMLGRALVDASTLDARMKPEQVAFKTKFVMKKSSFGTVGRAGEFTFDYRRGVINQHEEVFLLGTRRGIIERPNNRSYVFDGKTWGSEAACLNALKESGELQEKVLKELRLRDTNGQVAAYDSVEAQQYADATEQEDT